MHKTYIVTIRPLARKAEEWGSFISYLFSCFGYESWSMEVVYGGQMIIEIQEWGVRPWKSLLEDFQRMAQNGMFDPDFKYELKG